MLKILKAFKIIIIVYDVTKKSSFGAIKYWLKDVRDLWLKKMPN